MEGSFASGSAAAAWPRRGGAAKAPPGRGGVAATRPLEVARRWLGLP